ncbi:hypothetical protein [Streptomyces sp. A1547]|uniref:hypothetical protein n=1 Tax=Streptomyces sp. A1547 TaxID=2563105 RepID=UPI00109E8541|nr:hypothetical protein [Streptomyces sp. A1547]THA39804.1 hypothetical protein E6W17_09460 [Streptomyces sp. A1547]
MYPTPRGTSPLVVALVSTTLLGHSLPAGQAVGVAVNSCGLAAATLADGIPGRTQLPALAAALGTGVLIASYTLVDGSGVCVCVCVCGCGYIAWLYFRHRQVRAVAAGLERRSSQTRTRI